MVHFVVVTTSLWYHFNKNSIHFAPLGHNRVVRLSTKNRKSRRVHRMLTWKAQIWEKPRQPTDCKISLWEDYKDGAQRQRSLAPLLRQRAVTTEATTSFSLSQAEHLQCAQRILHYANVTKDRALLYRVGVAEKLVGYTDAEWARNTNDCRSTSVLRFSLGSVAIA